MTPSEFAAARRALGLSVTELAGMLGVNPQQVRRMAMPEAAGAFRPVSETTRRLLQAYLDGYRPADWPQP